MSDLADFLLARIAEDETRALAECEAKRRIVERVSEVKWTGSYAVRDVVLELLALSYADHPDYRDKWKR